MEVTDEKEREFSGESTRMARRTAYEEKVPANGSRGCEQPSESKATASH
ncbi:MAG: hypothetical protein ACREV9_17370 [Burkholderiales bacterium]